MSSATLRFKFSAYGENGRKESGVIEANNEADAIRRLTKSGKIPYEVTATDKAVSNGKSSRRSLFAPKLDLTRLFTDLAVMLGSGFNIDIALRAVADAEPNRHQKTRIQEILARIGEGKSVADAFAAQDEIPPDVAALISSGESSGKLGVVFSELAQNYNDRAKRRSQISESLLYPSFLIVVMIGTLLLLSLYLVPAIRPIFDNGGVDIPFVVRALDSVGGFFSSYGVIMLLGLLIVVALTIPALRTPAARARFANLATGIPGLRSLMQLVTRGRYLRVMSLLLGNGVPLLESMNLASSAAPAEDYRNRLQDSRQSVSGGASLWKSLEATGIFPEASLSLIRLGEESNNLAPIMLRAAILTDAQLQRLITRFLTFLTPAITITLGLLVGTLVISVMTTLLSINEIAIR